MVAENPGSIQPMVELWCGYIRGVGCECIQPMLELRAEYPGVFCEYAFFGCTAKYARGTTCG